jgi:hypothetical protein
LRGTGYIEKEEVIKFTIRSFILYTYTHSSAVHDQDSSPLVILNFGPLTQLREMVVALLDESDLYLSDSAVEAIVDNVISRDTSLQVFSLSSLFWFVLTCPVVVLLESQTFNQADSNRDGRIDPDEWEEFVKKYPTSLRNMSLPYLQ